MVTAIRPSDIIFAGGPFLYGLKNGALTRKLASYARGGEELEETHARASVGKYIDRDGNLRSAAVDVLRPSWMYSNDDLVNRKLCILLEDEATNLIENGDFEVDAVGAVANLSAVSRDTTVARFGVASLKITTTNVGSSGAYCRKRNGDRTPVTAGTVYSASLWYFATGSAIGASMRIGHEYYDAASGGSLVQSFPGTTTPLVAGWNRLTLDNVTAPIGATHALVTFYTVGAQGIFDVWIDLVQLEAGKQSSSEISTGTAAVTRSRDALSFPLYVAPNQNLAIYHRHIQGLLPNFVAAGGFNPLLCGLVNPAGSEPRLLLEQAAGSDDFQARHTITGTQVSAVNGAIAPTFNDVIENRLIYNGSTGTVRLGTAKAIGAETLSAESSANTPQAQWTERAIRINSYGDDSGCGRQGWIATIVVRWSGSAPSMDDFRGLLS